MVTLGLEQFRVNASAAFDQTQPVLTSLPDGGFLAEGRRTADASFEVLHPNLEALSDGNFLVTWTASFSNSRGGSGASLVARRLDGSGAPLDAPVTLPGSPWGTDVGPCRAAATRSPGPGLRMSACNMSTHLIGAAEFSTSDATGQLRFDAAMHMLYASIDADAQAEMAIELAGVASLGAGDFSL